MAGKQPLGQRNNDDRHPERSEGTARNAPSNNQGPDAVGRCQRLRRRLRRGQCLQGGRAGAAPALWRRLVTRARRVVGLSFLAVETAAGSSAATVGGLHHECRRAGSRARLLPARPWPRCAVIVNDRQVCAPRRPNVIAEILRAARNSTSRSTIVVQMGFQDGQRSRRRSA